MKTDFKLSRRQFLKGAAIAGAGMALPLSLECGIAMPTTKATGCQMANNPARGRAGRHSRCGPRHGRGAGHRGDPLLDQHRAVQGQPAPAFGCRTTTLWGFNPANPLGGGVQPQKHLGGIIVAERNVPLQITFYNKLTSNGQPNGTPLKSPIPVDTTLPGANQAQNRIAVHIHGGLVPWISDGGPFDWWAPNGTHGLSFLNNQVLNPAAPVNEAEYYYPNNQSARLLWYHDHAQGITRTNAYAGIATAYIIRDNFERAMITKGLPEFIETAFWRRGPIRELPIVIQDKIFVGRDIGDRRSHVEPRLPRHRAASGTRTSTRRTAGDSSVPAPGLPNPSVVAEMFGDTMLVNGTVYPQVDVEARRYRLRILNACNARFLNLQLYVADSDGQHHYVGPAGRTGS